MTPEERAAREAASALDADAAELTCPACSATFPPVPRCPDCGLRLA